jgi:hypothetical protein
MSLRRFRLLGSERFWIARARHADSQTRSGDQFAGGSYRRRDAIVRIDPQEVDGGALVHRPVGRELAFHRDQTEVAGSPDEQPLKKVFLIPDARALQTVGHRSRCLADHTVQKRRERLTIESTD